MQYAVKDNLIINKVQPNAKYLGCSIINSEIDLGELFVNGFFKYGYNDGIIFELTNQDKILGQLFIDMQKNKRKEAYKARVSELKEELVYLQVKIDVDKNIITEEENLAILADIEKLKIEIVKQQELIKKEIPKTW